MDYDRPTYSLQILENSDEGIVQIELKSVSGIPRFSASIVISDRLNSEILSPSIDIFIKLLLD